MRCNNYILAATAFCLFIFQQLNSQSNSQGTWSTQSQASSGFSIYCISNQDSTGSCNRVDDSQPIVCEMIPGGLINCKDQKDVAIQCVLYSGVIGSQGYFYCTKRTEPGIRDNRINNQRFSTSNPITPANNLNPLPDSSRNSSGSNNPSNSVNVFTDSIKDVFGQ